MGKPRNIGRHLFGLIQALAGLATVTTLTARSSLQEAMTGVKCHACPRANRAHSRMQNYMTH